MINLLAALILLLTPTPTPDGQCRIGDMYITYTPTVTPTPTLTPTVTPTLGPTVTPGGPTLTPTLTPTITPTPTPTITPTESQGYYWVMVADVYLTVPPGQDADYYWTGVQEFSNPCDGTVYGMAVSGTCSSDYSDGYVAGCMHALGDVSYVIPGVHDRGWPGHRQFVSVQLASWLRYDDGSVPVVPGSGGELWWARDWQGGTRWRGGIDDWPDGRYNFLLDARLYALCYGAVTPTPAPPTPDPAISGGECIDVDWRATVVAGGGRCLTIPTLNAPGAEGTQALPGLEFCSIPAPSVSILGMDTRMLVGIGAVIMALLGLAASLRN